MLFCIIYSFHMPLFMMISGFFASRSFDMDFLQLLKKKAIQLLLPCLSCGIIVEFFDNSWTNLYLILFGHLWFLKSLFLCYVLGWIAFKFPNKLFGILVALMLSQISVIYKVHLLFPAFLIGVFLSKHTCLLKNTSLQIICLSTFVIGLFFLNPEVLQPIGLSEYILSCKWDSIPPILFNRLYSIAIGIAGSAFFIMLFYRLFSTRTVCLLSKWGELTLGIYFFQTIIVECLLREHINLNNVPLFISNYLIIPLISVLVICISVCLVSFVKKFKITSLLILGENRYI